MKMARGRQREAWSRTSAVMAMLANCHRDPKRRKKAYEPRDFNPFETTGKRHKPGLPVNGRWADYRGMFIRAGFTPTNPNRFKTPHDPAPEPTDAQGSATL